MLEELVLEGEGSENLTPPRDLPWWFWRVGLMESWMAPLTEFGFADIMAVLEDMVCESFGL